MLLPLLKILTLCLVQVAGIVIALWVIGKLSVTPMKRYDHLLIVALDTADLQKEIDRLYDVEWRIVKAQAMPDGKWYLILERERQVTK